MPEKPMIFECPTCGGVLSWAQFQGMMMTYDIDGKMYYRARCDRCGKMDVLKKDVNKLKERT